MASISRTALFGKLNRVAYRAVESATVFCKLRGNPYVELVHWLHQILQLQDSDLHRIVRHFDSNPRAGGRHHRGAGPLAARRDDDLGLVRACGGGGGARLDIRHADVRRSAGAHRLSDDGHHRNAQPAQRVATRSRRNSTRSSPRR
jgi:hypothetical protein